MQVILHNIRSLHNVGSIFRTADGAGIQKIYLTGYTPLPVDELGRPRREFTKVSLNAEKNVSWEHLRSLPVLLRRLQKNGYNIWAVEQSPKSVSLKKVTVSGDKLTKVVLLMGNEVRGSSPAILEHADRIIEIPMFGKKESLNVSVAFGVVAYFLKLQDK